MNTTITDRDELEADLNNAQGHLRALEIYSQNHPGIVPPLLGVRRDAVRTITAALAALPTKDTIMNIDIARETLRATNDELRALHTAAGNRALTPAQQTRWNELTEEAEDVERNIVKAEEDAARAKRVAEARARWGSLSVGSSWVEHDPGAVARMDAGTARDAALQLLDRSAGHLDDSQREHLDKMLRADSTTNYDSGALAKHIVLTSGEDYRNAFHKITAPGMSNIVTMSERESAAVREVQRASMAEGTGSTGGYAVPAFLDPTIALNAQGSANPIRKLARNETITTSKWKGVSTAGVSWAFVGEGQASSDASPTVAQPTVDINTARAWITYSIELQADAVDLDRQLFALLAAGWDDTVAGALATGTGVGEPKGLITALDAITASEVAITTPGSLAAADIAKAWVALPDRARGHASWIMHESVREAIAGWGDAFGTRTVDYGGQLQKLRDRPVYSTEKFPALASTTGSANQIVVGDLSGYLIAQRAGMTIEPVQTVVNADGFPVGKRGMFAWARIGADVVDSGLLRLLRQGA